MESPFIESLKNSDHITIALIAHDNKKKGMLHSMQVTRERETKREIDRHEGERERDGER